MGVSPHILTFGNLWGLCIHTPLVRTPLSVEGIKKKTWMFDSLLSHLLKHLIKLKEILNFFVGTKLWGPARYSTFITYGNYLPYNILWGHTDLTCEVCVSIPYLRGPPLLNFFVGTKLWGPARSSTFITYGNYLPYNILWGHTDLTCEVCVSIPYLRGPPLLLTNLWGLCFHTLLAWTTSSVD